MIAKIILIIFIIFLLFILLGKWIILIPIIFLVLWLIRLFADLYWYGHDNGKW